MSCILHIDASPRGERSVSRMLSREFIEGWCRLHPEDKIIYRDVGREPPPAVTEAWIAGAYSAADERSAEAQAAMQVSDTLIDEFLSADRYVLGVPMHNFSVPSGFKAYVDQIVRIGRTFDSNWRGLVMNKKMLVIMTSGGEYTPGGSNNDMDFQKPWIRTIFRFIGIKDITFIRAEGLNEDEQKREKNIQHAKDLIAELVWNW